jgi:hypothetical protein
MQWLLHGEMTNAVADALVRHGHGVHKAEELELPPEAGLPELLWAAQQKQWEILTTDVVLVNAPFEQQLFFNRTIVFLQLDGGDVEQDDAVDRLFARYKRLSPRRLYTVTGSRVKIRQLPGAVG